MQNRISKPSLTPTPLPRKGASENYSFLTKSMISSVFVIFVVLAFLPVVTTYAQTEPEDTYKMLAPLPGTFNPSSGETNIQRYLPGIFNLAIGVSAAFVLLNLVFGGFLWMSSDAFTKKEEGKKRIENSLKGILLVAGAYIILFTINPQLLDVKLDIESIEVPSSSATSTTGGVSASGLQQATRSAVDDLKAQCSGCVVITSTTGGAHTVGSLHYQGLAVDIAPNDKLNQFLVGTTNPPGPCGTVTKTLGSKTATFLWEPKGAKCGGTEPSSGDHWHMSVRP